MSLGVDDYVVYIKNSVIVAIIRSDGAIIPVEPLNSDYQQFVVIDTPDHLCRRVYL